jgi:aspartokinase-like uncharacterized kinase
MTAPTPEATPRETPTGTPVAANVKSRVAVVKLGGSLMGSDALDALLAQVVACPVPVVIVPGGGLFADAVRAAQARLGFSDGLAHRLALDAMGAFAEVLAERLGGAPIHAEAAVAAAAARSSRPVLWTPSNWRAGVPGIPESWALTSDSAALIVARAIGAATLVLVKSAEPAADDDPTRLRPDILDAAFPGFLAAEALPDAAGKAEPQTAPGLAAPQMDRAGRAPIVRLVGPRDWPRLAEALAEPETSLGQRVTPADFAPPTRDDRVQPRDARDEDATPAGRTGNPDMTR